jgi:hypothetical protein
MLASTGISYNDMKLYPKCGAALEYKKSLPGFLWPR